MKTNGGTVNNGIKTRVGKRNGINSLQGILFKCSNKECKYTNIGNEFGINTCGSCGTQTNVIPPARER